MESVLPYVWVPCRGRPGKQNRQADRLTDKLCSHEVDFVGRM